MQVVEYPLWRIAVEEVLSIFEKEGYGAQITHEQLRDWMAIPEPKTIEQAKKTDLDYMAGMERTRTDLLEQSNICLYPVIGVGYEILHPNDQIRKGVDKYVRQSQRKLARSAQILANVDTAQLNIEGRNLQITKINRLAFLKSAFRKRTAFNGPRKQIQ
jgi:hypothetical protein